MGSYLSLNDDKIHFNEPADFAFFHDGFGVRGDHPTPAFPRQGEVGRGFRKGNTLKSKLEARWAVFLIPFLETALLNSEINFPSQRNVQQGFRGGRKKFNGFE